MSIIGCIASWGAIDFCTVEPLESSDAALIQKEFPQLKRSLFLLPYSPFLNPIEDCWTKVKKNTRKHQLSKVDQLTPKIAVACAAVAAEYHQNWIRHSNFFWDRCLSKELLLCEVQIYL